MATVPEKLDLAIKHHEAGQLTEAKRLYQEILQVDPRHSDALHLLGLVAHHVGQHDTAIDYIQRALSSKPDSAVFLTNLGAVFSSVGRLDEAVASYRRALQIQPAYVKAHNNLGVAFRAQGKLGEAVTSCQQALLLKPDYAEAHNNLGAAYQAQGKHEEAITSYQRAVQIKPDYAEVHSNLGAALEEEGKLEAAVACYRRALDLDPNCLRALNNLAKAMKEQGRLQEAAAFYRTALALDPDFAVAHKNYGHLLLLRGDFEQGWQEYEWRTQTVHIDFKQQTPWDGESLQGRTILLYAEQGFGDTIQFVRYAMLVKRFGGTVIAQIQPELCRLLARVDGIDELFRRGQQLPEYDVHSAFTSLPCILGTTLETIPAEIPYLCAEPALIEHWNTKLSGLKKLRVGLVWQGRQTHLRDRWRSISLKSFQPLLDFASFSYVSLQKGYGAEQVVECGFADQIADFASEINDFADTAAIIENLDLVMSVDTSVAHLAGAMGKPTWVLLPHAPDWRWMLDREDSPWYPTMRLFRQQDRGDWGNVLRRVAAALQDFVIPRKDH